jgi:tetratricopeptide (TPR) repeat protein
VTPTRQRLAVVAVLVVAVLAVYAPVREYPFVQLDDNEYVFENPFVRTGLSRANVEWAVTAFHSGHWHPLTWISLMADCHWSGADPGALHAVNAALHAAGAALLFLWLHLATGSLWRSAIVAGLFALHPLRVESVAWISARKDVLSGVFVMLTALAWVRYARRETLARYLAVVVAFALGLSSKPTLAILPAGLLLLDLWPLGRGRMPLTRAAPPGARSPARLVAEKIPLLALAALTLSQTWASQQAAGAVVGESLPLAARLGNAFWNYALYLGRTFWPVELAVFYPLQAVSVLQASLGAALLAGVTVAAWRLRERAPYVLVGWLWFAGTLLPVSGVIQFGGQSMADRYSYIPHIGLLVALVWGAADLVGRLRIPQAAAAVVAALLLVVLAARSSDQRAYWRDSVALFERAIAVAPGNYMAHNNLGVVLEARGQRDEAAAHYAAAVRFNPTWPEAQNNLGITYAWRGDYAGARRHFGEALRIRPGFARAQNNMATAFAREGNLDAAIAHYTRAVELDPGYLDAHYALADALERRGRGAEAARHYRRVLELAPGMQPAAARLEALRAAGVAAP